jgi:hypothetical protein
MRSPQNCGSGFCFPFMSPDMSHSHITQPPVSWPPRHYLVTSVMFLVLVSAQDLHGHCSSCLQSTFTQVVKKFCSPSLFADPESCRPWPNLGPPQPGSRTHFPREGLGPPSWTECKIPDWAPKLFELKTLLCQKQTHERQKILTRQFWSKGCKHVLQLSRHMSTKMADSGFDAVVPAPYLRFVQVKGSQSFQIG